MKFVTAFLTSFCSQLRSNEVRTGQFTRITKRLCSAFFESLKRLSLRIWSTVLNSLFTVDDDKNKVSLILMTRRIFWHFFKCYPMFYGQRQSELHRYLLNVCSKVFGGNVSVVLRTLALPRETLLISISCCTL